MKVLNKDRSLENIKAVIFDLDGTITDTERIHQKAWPEAYREYGINMTEEQSLYMRSMGEPFASRQLALWYGDDLDHHAIRMYRRSLAVKYMNESGIPLKPYVRQTLTELRQRGYMVALATATPLERATEMLKSLGVDDCFDRICSVSQVKRGKPMPDVYLFAAEQCGFEPNQCVGVEDSPNGVMSVCSAGLYTVMVPDMTQPDGKIFPFIDAVCENLSELTSLLN